MAKNDKEEAKPKKKAIKNYFLLILIFAASIGLTMYLCNWYRVYDEYQKETPVIRGSLSEITKDELDHYILENPTTVIYMCTSDDILCRNYEKELKKLIEQKNLQESIIYLNLNAINNDEFVEQFNNNYPYKVKLTKRYPALVIFEEGQVSNILQGTETEKLTITKTKQFIEINKIGE